jgi:hypothetical protein
VPRAESGRVRLPVVRVHSPLIGAFRGLQFTGPIWLTLLILRANHIWQSPWALYADCLATALICSRGAVSVLRLEEEQVLIRNLWQTRRIPVEDLKVFVPGRRLVLFRILDRASPSPFMRCMALRTRHGREIMIDASLGPNTATEWMHGAIKEWARQHHVNFGVDLNHYFRQ